jgi:integrator complex subunit 1
MLWDPVGPARKPPRESVELLLTVEESFGLSAIFQASTEPDFLLMTIGQTTRGAIERAYDWLLPIISTVQTTISRLPSNASCFLLLRAYGTEGDERKQLKKLSAPLLVHVRESLEGKYGEADAIKAFELLMTEVASPQADRRRCARRVLHDALEGEQQFDDSRQNWMENILHLNYSQSLVVAAIKHLVSVFGRKR